MQCRHRTCGSTRGCRRNRCWPLISDVRPRVLIPEPPARHHSACSARLTRTRGRSARADGQLHRLGHVTVHAGLPGTTAVLADDMQAERDHRGARSALRGPTRAAGACLKPSSTGISQSISTRRTPGALIASSASSPLQAVSGCRLSLFSMPRMTLVEMLSSGNRDAEVTRPSGGKGCAVGLAGAGCLPGVARVRRPEWFWRV